jgi:ribosome recycling factor
MLKEVLKETEDKMKKCIESVKREFNEVRTGRAHPGLIEGLHVECYGQTSLLKEVASITIQDPATIAVQPWDPSTIPDIERGIANSTLGLNPMNDGKIVRIPIPPLSEERRRELTKIVKDMAEKAKVSIRTVRRDANDKLKKLKADKAINEDDEFKAHETVQKLTDQFSKDIDQILADKNAALMEK